MTKKSTSTSTTTTTTTMVPGDDVQAHGTRPGHLGQPLHVPAVPAHDYPTGTGCLRTMWRGPLDAVGPLWRRLSRGAAPRSRQGTAARVGHQRDRAATQQPAAAGGHGGRADPDLCVAPPRAHLPPHPSCQLPKLQNTSAAWMGAA